MSRDFEFGPGRYPLFGSAIEPFGNRQLEIVNVLARSSKIVAESNDVVLAKIAATLHFDKYKCIGARVLDSVGRANADVYRFATVNDNLTVVERNPCGPVNYEPMLGPL